MTIKGMNVLAGTLLGLVTLLGGANPVAAGGTGSTYGACVAHHATIEGGFSSDHNPGMHRGFAGWTGCPGA